MKRLLFLLFVLPCSVFSAFAQNQNTSLEDINAGWSRKTISNVVNGSLGIMLERFDQTWPTWMVGAVRGTMEKGLAKQVLDEKTELTVTVDSKNGYVSVGDAGTDGEYMSACYWNRSNGHKLLAVLLGKPTDPCIEVLCTYDYDPAKKSLTPEPDILKGYRWADRKEYSQLFCKLPKKGKTILVDEWGAEEPRRHTFTWDGMKPVYAKSEPLEVDENGLDPIIVTFKGAQPNIKDFVAALLSQRDGEAMAGIKQSWDLYRNGMKQMPGDDLIVDVQNGYVGYVSEDEESRHVIECCYWNYADKKHKLVAFSNNLFQNGSAVETESTGIEFYIYDTATHRMKLAYAGDLGIEFDAPPGTHATSHELPRTGKTIVYNFHTSSGKFSKRLTWNGNKFIKE
ncbi:MAG: hypothetical protein IJ569_03630 [Prevotella sp.]|nr:hypothetical protein [Prevotella sp.]